MALQKYSATPLTAPFMKRNDIHGLRAYVILPLMIHNFNTRLLPYAYLAVDIFFVTSGYFIATILNKREKITCTTIASFFYRRIRQLLPTYLTVILLTLLLAVFFIDPNDQDLLIEEARGALCLYSNLKNLFWQETVFDLIEEESAAYHFFAHTWLICVELQFCLIVPLLFKCLISETSNQKRFVWGIGAFSCLAQLFSPTLFAREFTLLHIWQFMIGMMAFYWNQDNKQNLPVEVEKKTEWIEQNSTNFGLTKNFDFMVTPVCLFLIFLVMFVNEQVGLARIRCSLFAALIIMMGTKEQSSFLTNRVIVWIGQHSYTIYLVHWPLIVYWKYLFNDQLEFLEGIEIILISFFVAWAIDLLVDRLFMANLKTKFLSIMAIITLYLCCELLLGYLGVMNGY